MGCDGMWGLNEGSNRALDFQHLNCFKEREFNNILAPKRHYCQGSIKPRIVKYRKAANKPDKGTVIIHAAAILYKCDRLTSS
jgi:hypothetical protein